VGIHESHLGLQKYQETVIKHSRLFEKQEINQSLRNSFQIHNCLIQVQSSTCILRNSLSDHNSGDSLEGTGLASHRLLELDPLCERFFRPPLHHCFYEVLDVFADDRAVGPTVLHQDGEPEVERLGHVSGPAVQQVNRTWPPVAQ
jgi:hypothetical protein